MSKETNIHKGHRSAMRKKLLAVGSGAFHPHELLEMLLYYSAAQGDTNPTAHRLLETIGGLDRVLSADAALLTSVPGIGTVSARLLSLVLPIGKRAEASLECSFDGSRDYESYLRESAGQGTLRLLLMDSGATLIADASLNCRDMGEVSELSREMLQNALHYRASIAVLLRRCDGRAPQPTAEELETLRALCETLAYVDVRLADYVLVSGERICRVARSFPEYVFVDPDVSASFRVPGGRDEETLSSDAALLGELLSFAGVRDEKEPKELLSTYGSLGNLFLTPAKELIRAGFPEKIAVLLALVVSLYARGEIAALSKTASLDSAERQADYFARHYIGVRDERLSLLLLDEKSRPIELVSFGDGGVGNTTVDLRKLVELALFHRAASVALAHNHPGGTLTPSAEDVLATRSVEQALAGVGVTLDEHYVLVGRAFTPIRLYSEELLTVRPPSFYGEASFREIHRQKPDVYRPRSHVGLREKQS